MRASIVIATLLFAPALTAAAQAPPIAQHVPIHAAHVGTVELRFTVAEPDRVRGVVVRCIPRAAKAKTHSAEARRAASGYVANVPAPCAQPPGFRYWAVLLTAAGEQPLFASADAPHEVQVTFTEEREAELTQLRAHGYKRSRVMVAAEGVSFGARSTEPGAPARQDRYYRIETGYGYSFFGFIEDIALSLVRVRGESASAVADELEGELRDPLEAGERSTPGVDYGRATVTLRVLDFVRTKSSLLLGASQEGFEYGWSGELVLGDPWAEHLAIGAETVTTLGSTGFLRLGFNALPEIPMGARVEVTDFPLGHDAAVRLLYEVGYRFTPATSLTLRGGYQGRTSVVGGPSLAAAFEYGF